MKQRNQEPIVVYKTERITVVRNAFRDFSVYVDGELIAFRGTQIEAEHEGAMWLAEEMRKVQVA